MKRNQLETEVKRDLLKWIPKLHLDEWRFTLKFEKTDVPQGWSASISADPAYLRATIYIYPQHSKDIRLDREHTIIHELIHCHVEEINALVRRSWKDKVVTEWELHDATERLVQRIANSLLPINRKVADA